MLANFKLLLHFAKIEPPASSPATQPFGRSGKSRYCQVNSINCQTNHKPRRETWRKHDKAIKDTSTPNAKKWKSNIRTLTRPKISRQQYLHFTIFVFDDFYGIRILKTFMDWKKKTLIYAMFWNLFWFSLLFLTFYLFAMFLDLTSFLQYFAFQEF